VAPPPGQVAVEQPVPSAYSWQPPAPSHLPFVPQVVTPLSVQTPLGSAEPAASGEQVPALPATLQAWQEGQLDDPQHTPSMQLPLMHWSPDVQTGPFGLRAQL